MRSIFSELLVWLGDLRFVLSCSSKMAVDDDQDIDFCSVLSVPGPSHQSIVLPSGSHIAESIHTLSRPSSLNVVHGARNSRSNGSQLHITPKLEDSLWTRYKPLVETLEEPINQYLHIDVAYKGCLQHLANCQKVLFEKNLSRVDVDDILDDVERELWHAQHLALWKRGVLLGADQSLYKLTGRNCDAKHENPAVVKAKKKCKKTVVSAVKESVRRSKRERSSPCPTKIKPKEINRSSNCPTPRQNSSASTPSNPVRAKRKTKRRESTSESVTSNKKRSSGRIAKPLRKKQTAVTEASDVAPVNISDEPTYCLCKQVSFGDMIGCDNDKCTVEWFHFGCVQLKTKPKGKWYCPLCRGDRTNILRTPSVK